MAFDTPVVLCIFNRPSVTRRVLDAVRMARPKTLLVIGDGPRPNRLGDDEKIRQTRAVLDDVDWPCHLETNYSAINLGCRSRVELSMRQWPDFVAQGGLAEIVESATEYRYWNRILGAQYRGETTSWAYSWLANAWMMRSLNILPDVNLVRNIGFDEEATHTKGRSSPLADIPTSSLRHWSEPDTFVRNKTADAFTFQSVFAEQSKLRRWKRSFARRWAQWSDRQAA